MTRYCICHLQEERHEAVLSENVKADEPRMRCHISGWEDHPSSKLQLIDFSTGIMNGYELGSGESHNSVYS